MIYGKYTDIRNAAWQCLIDFNVASLPVDLKKITDEFGIRIIKNSEVYVLSGCESGACVYDEESREWYMVYDDECSLGRRRFTIAHELGHLLLGHELINGYHGHTFNSDKPQSESEADMFAARLLAPACVLWALDLHTAEDIAEVCSISIAAAKVRAKRMEELYKRQMFLASPLERKVFEQFKGFVEGKKGETKP